MTYPAPAPYAPPSDRPSPLAWVSFGLGLGAVITAIVPLMGIFSWGLLIGSIVTGILAIKRGAVPKWAAITGIIASGLSAIWNLVSVIIAIVLLVGVIGGISTVAH